MGLKDNTMLNYMYMYEMFVNPYIGKSKISGLLYSDVKGFYNMLYRERGLKVSTIDNVNTVLHQVLELAVQNRLIPANPSDNAIRELKHMHGKEIQKRQALTAKEQELFLITSAARRVISIGILYFLQCFIQVCVLAR